MIEFDLAPPMGWYSGFSSDPTTESSLLTTITYISQHLKAFGYEYIIIDDSWYAGAESDEHGCYIPTASQFSSAKNGIGFKTLGEYIHSLKLKFGLHISPYIPSSAVMKSTCLPDGKTYISDIASPEGTRYVIDFNKFGATSYYEHIFKLYASWGVDLIYIDMTKFNYSDLPYISDALKNCGRDILLYVASPIIDYKERDFVHQYANMWPISDTFLNGWSDIVKAFNLCKLWNPIVGYNSWPMLPFIASELEKRFTPDEQMTLLTLCAIFKSPIILDGNFKDLPDTVQTLLANMDVLSLLRHSHAAYELSHTNEQITWTTQANDGCRYLAIFNTTDQTVVVSTNLNQSNSYLLYDLWSHENLKDIKNNFALEIPSHGVRLVKLIAKY